MLKTWTAYQLHYLSVNYPAGNLNSIAIHLGKTRLAIKAKAKALGLRRTVNVRRIFTEAEINYIVQNYANNKTESIALELNASINSVYDKAFRLGLRKSAEFKKSEACGCFVAGSVAGKAFRFQKGHIPANKGTKIAESVKNRIQHTFFTKGHVPANLKPVGTESVTVDGYVVIKVAEPAVWKLKHRLVWEKAHGPVLPENNIVFIDGNKLNCDLANLEMVSSSELMLRNTIRRYPAEMQTTYRILGKLNSNIRKYEKQA